jgi:hypothetical protein
VINLRRRRGNGERGRHRSERQGITNQQNRGSARKDFVFRVSHVRASSTSVSTSPSICFSRSMSATPLIHRPGCDAHNLRCVDSLRPQVFSLTHPKGKTPRDAMTRITAVGFLFVDPDGIINSGDNGDSDAPFCTDRTDGVINIISLWVISGPG